MSPVRQPYRRPIRIAGEQGEFIDPAIANDVAWIREEFKVKVTDGYAATGHTASGEHPLGLAIDIVPDEARGGTWDDIARLVKWAEPQADKPRSPFRWVGYNGDKGHGDPDHAGGNAHGHLSWQHNPSTGKVSTIFGADGKPNKGITLPGGGGGGGGTQTHGGVLGALQDAASTVHPGLGAVLGVADATGADEAAVDAVTEPAADLAGDVAKKLVEMAVGAIGQDGARALLYVGFVVGGSTLAVLGVARAAGLKPKHVAGAATLVATRNPKAAAAVGGATS